MSKVLVIKKTGEVVPLPDMNSSTLENIVIERGLATRETVATRFGWGHGEVFKRQGSVYRKIAFTQDAS